MHRSIGTMKTLNIVLSRRATTQPETASAIETYKQAAALQIVESCHGAILQETAKPHKLNVLLIKSSRIKKILPLRR